MKSIGLKKALELYTGKAFSCPLYAGLLYSEPADGDTTFAEPTAPTYSRICLNNRTQGSSSYTNVFGDVTVSDGSATATNSSKLYFSETYNEDSTSEDKIDPWVDKSDSSKQLIKYFGIFDAATGGNCLDCSEIDTPLKPGYEGDNATPENWTKKATTVVIRKGGLKLIFKNAVAAE
ncbi:MAG: hypothetical protein ACI4MS_08010 [Candidatus Coproplasma sp.]